MHTSRLFVGLVALTVVVAAPALGVEHGSYDLQPEGPGWRAACSAQGFDALIGPTEVRMTPPDGAWGFVLAFEGLGRDGHLEAVAPAGVAATGPRAELHRGPVAEWYVSSASGLEQGLLLA